MRYKNVLRCGVVALVATAWISDPTWGDTSLVPPAGLGGKAAVTLKAQPFGLHQVRLLDGPFLRAQLRDRDYLLKLDPNRLLHNFRVNAGLPSSASPLGGWEAPNIELRGHFVGHYLSACALLHAATGDQQVKDRAALIVRELAACQAALGESGYLSAFPESFIDRVETTGKVWAPYYTLHKILAGLLDVHALCGNSQALEVAKRMGNWIAARNDRLSDEQLERMLAVEHGGINESMANLYAASGDAQYLRCARRLYHKSVLDPLAAGEDKLAGLHANTQFPKVLGTARLYELTGEDALPLDRRVLLGPRGEPPQLRDRRQQRPRAFRPARQARRARQPLDDRNLQHLQHAQAHASSFRLERRGLPGRLLRTRTLQSYPRLAGSRKAA